MFVKAQGLSQVYVRFIQLYLLSISEFHRLASDMDLFFETYSAPGESDRRLSSHASRG